MPSSSTFEKSVKKSKPLVKSSPITTRPIGGGIYIARVSGFHEKTPLIEIPNFIQSVPAFAVTCPLSLEDAGSIVAVVFDCGNPQRPIVLGKVVTNLGQTGKGATLTSEQEISLRCGKASLTLSANGDIVIRGNNVTSRASHTNRIRGGNVQIN